VATKPTFRLDLPADRQVETYRVQLANGVVVTRTVDQLQRPSTTEPSPRG
jgi:hypothetical protein